MKSILTLTLILCLHGSLFAQSWKIDDKLSEIIENTKDKARLTSALNNNSEESVRAIIQWHAPVTAGDLLDLTLNKGTIKRDLKSLNAIAAELPASAVQGIALNPRIRRISFDAPVISQSGEPGIVSGATLAAQQYGATGDGIGVAVIDSGISSHPDLPNVFASVDFVQPWKRGRTDAFGHGTHVAGIIGGSGEASGGAYRGIAPGVKLVDLRVLDRNGTGYTSDVIAAIEWAIENKNRRVNGKSLNIRVINLALGHRPYESTETDPLTTICRLAIQNGIVVVAAVGNYGRDNEGNTLYGGVTSPGNEPAVITAGSMSTWGTDSRMDDVVSSFSSRGPTLVENVIKPDIAAPGFQIVAAGDWNSTLAEDNPQLRVGTSYLKLSGTSMASAVVSGAVAMMLEVNPNLTPNAVKAALMFTAEDRIESPLEIGAGYLNVAGAVNLAANIDTSRPTGQYWILNNGVNLDYTNVIAGAPVVWGQTIVWSDALYSGNFLLYNEEAWSQTIVWGIDSLAWATTIVWEIDAFSLAEDVDGMTIVWEILDGLTIVWDDLMF